MHDFAQCLNNKQQIDSVLLDFSKAFDKVDHHGLVLKLKHCGINNNILKWISSFLNGRTQTVLVEGCQSSAQPVMSGVPQGTVLGPLLFLIYINDIDQDLSPGTKIRLFAYDSLLYRTINDLNDTQILQKDLHTLQKWESTWKMEFHPQKCQVLRITNKSNIIKNTYKIHDFPLEETNSAKYLGIVIDSKLTWKEHITSTSKKSNKVLAFLRRNLSNCPRNVKADCYKTLVRPILEYGCAVWDPHHKNDIESLEKIQKRAARFVTGNYDLHHSSTKFNMSKLQWKPLEERRACNKLNLLYKSRKGFIDLPPSQFLKENP